MKKILAKLICLMLITTMAISGLVACSTSSWKGGNVTLKDAGDVIENAGFIAETDNYFYFINGVESTTANNTMGTPLKGALLVADKNDLSKTEVVVPKLFVASDYSAGVFIDNGYVYYATPSTEKNSEGLTAYDEIAFMRTKLDGSGATEEFFTLDTTSALATQYRFVKAENGQVFLYYYHSDEPAIICYNTSTKTSATVINQEKVDDGDCLDKHFFLSSKVITDKENKNVVVGYYTTTVYEDKNETLYNRVYVIKAGSDKGELLIDGDNTNNIYDAKYSISLIKDDYMFFTKTSASSTNTYAIKETDARESANWNAEEKLTKITNSSYIQSSTLINSLDDIYVMGETKIYKASFSSKQDKTPIALKEDISKLLFVDDGFMYFYNAEGHIARINLNDDNKQMVLVSADTASSSWYDVELKTIGENKYLFYCDNSTTGKSYIKVVNLTIDTSEDSDDILSKDTDDDGEDDLFYFNTEKIKVLGKMTDLDLAQVFDSKVNVQATYSPADGIGANDEDDQKFKDEIAKLRAEYEGLSASVKEKVADATKNTLNAIEKAFEVAEKYKELADIEFVGSAKEAEDLGIKAKYDQVKDYIKDFKNNNNTFRDAVEAYISNNLKAHYDKAVKLFEPKD